MSPARWRLCPGCTDCTIPRKQLVCLDCWLHLPIEIRKQLSTLRNMGRHDPKIARQFDRAWKPALDMIREKRKTAAQVELGV